jgi:hypothetical protein
MFQEDPSILVAWHNIGTKDRGEEIGKLHKKLKEASESEQPEIQKKLAALMQDHQGAVQSFPMLFKQKTGLDWSPPATSEAEKQAGRIELEREKQEGRIALEEAKGENWVEHKDPQFPQVKYIKNRKTGEIKQVSKVTKGMRIETADGTVIQMGGDGDLTKKTIGAIEGKQLAYRESFTRMEAIAKEFKPEYQEVGSRFAAAWTGKKAKLGMSVSKKDKTFLTKYAAYKRKAISNINLYIKEITGAQMSEKAGEKWYQGDDPVTFKAKMDDVLLYSRAAIARYDWYRAKGTLTDPEIRKLIAEDQAISLDDLVDRMRGAKEGG